MGDLSFAKKLGTKAGLKASKSQELPREGMHFLGPATPMPWLVQLALSLPGVAAGWMSLIDWCKDSMGERLERDLQKPDV